MHYYSKVLISEYTGGVILGAVLEKTSYSVTSIYTDKIRDHAIKYCGYSKRGNTRINYHLISEVTGEYDSLIIAAKDELLDLITQVWPKLKGSGTFAAYEQDIVEAGKSYEAIIAKGIAANVMMEEIWTREFQVLPGRTHPDVRTRIGTSGGYIISGIKLAEQQI